MKVTKYKEKQVAVMEKFTSARDCDFALYFHLMGELGYNTDTMTAHEMLKGMATGKYPHFESVRRTRQLIENERNDLRGKSYAKRHKVLEPEVKNELGYHDTPEGAPGTTP